MQNKIELELQTGLKQAVLVAFDEAIDDTLVHVEIPKDNTKGDYASNIAMRLAKVLKKSPLVIAQAIAEVLPNYCPSIQTVDVAAPGFLNFWIKKNELANLITTILEADQHYGHNNIGNNQKVLVEWISANPTGPLHIGHARGAAWGDAMCRLMEASGYDVLREYYINDAGNQINQLAYSLIARYRQQLGLDFELPNDGYHGEDVKVIAKKLLEEYGTNLLEGDAFNFFKEKGIRYELDQIIEDLSLFRVHMDSWSSEQSLYDTHKVAKVIDKMTELNLVYEDEGAVWFKSQQFGDDKDRVLKKSDGTYTYLTPDIAYHLDKIERGYSQLVNIWGADHHGYIPRMKAALSAMGHEDVLEVDVVQIVRMVENGVEIKMSKRTGNAMTLREFCEDVGVDAVRYNMVARALETHFDFDVAVAKQQSNDNPVYYAQYAHARMCSIFNKVENVVIPKEFTRLVHAREIDLLKHLGSFTEVVSDAAKTRQPNKITNYIQKLAQYFHSFYGACKVNDENEPELSSERLALVKATQITLRNALSLIGVEAVEKM